jgi:hypothetical protein
MSKILTRRRDVFSGPTAVARAFVKDPDGTMVE